ncbi:MAG TPA: FHA domain-containing protein [Planctomycetota bacterium]|nr:FHA domain-containing protein [Planctomycetota bacterium]
MTAILEILSGDLEGRAYDIDEAPFRIGRKDDCAIVLPKKYVSRQHAEIVEKDGRYLVRGLSQKNPIFANGKDVAQLALEDGSEFEICGIRFRFKSSGRGETREERKASRVNSLVSGAVGGAPTTAYRRSKIDDDIEDGPLPDEDEESKTEELDGSGEIKNAKKSAPAQLKSKSGGSGEGWRPDPNEGPRGRVVFGDEESGAASAPSDAKKSQKSSGDDKEERTDQIDVSKFKAGPEDPFAEKKERTPEEIAAHEKFVRFLVAAGVVGIAIAGAMFWWMQREPKVVPPLEIELKPPVAVNEVRRYDEPLNEQDPPDVVRETPYDGSPTELISAEDPNVAYVEWAVPETQSTAYFLVRGIQPGETTFTVTSKKKNIRRYHVKVEGVSRHALLKKGRIERLAGLTPEELKKEIQERIRQGEELDKALLTPGPKQERYPRQALHDYELAEESLEILSKKIDQGGVGDPDFDGIRTSVKSHVEKAKETWRLQVTQKKKTYDDLVRRRQIDPAVVELRALLWLVGDSCDLDYMRWELLLTKVWDGLYGYKSPNFESPGCIEEKK